MGRGRQRSAYLHNAHHHVGDYGRWFNQAPVSCAMGRSRKHHDRLGAYLPGGGAGRGCGVRDSGAVYVTEYKKTITRNIANQERLIAVPGWR